MAHAVLLVAVHRAELGQAHRQVAVAALLELVDLDVERAVHRLDVVLLYIGVVARALLDLHAGEHAVFVEAQMPRRLPEDRTAHMGRIDDLVAGLVVFLAPVFLDRHADARALREPVHEPGTDLLRDGEQFQLLAQKAMVALFGLFFAGEDGVEFGLILRHDAVDALEHLVLLVAAVVATGHAGQFHDADLLGVLHVRAAAHLDVVADRVDRNRLAFGDVRQALELVLLPGQELLAFRARDRLLDERLVQGDQAGDFRLDLGEILRRKAVRQVEIVVETLVRRRADVDLHVVKQIHDRTRRHVGGAVAPF